MASQPLQRLLRDAESLATRFEILRLELLAVIWQLRGEMTRAAVVETKKRSTRNRKRAAR